MQLRAPLAQISPPRRPKRVLHGPGDDSLNDSSTSNFNLSPSKLQKITTNADSSHAPVRKSYVNDSAGLTPDIQNMMLTMTPSASPIHTPIAGYEAFLFSPVQQSPLANGISYEPPPTRQIWRPHADHLEAAEVECLCVQLLASAPSESSSACSSSPLANFSDSSCFSKFIREISGSSLSFPRMDDAYDEQHHTASFSTPTLFSADVWYRDLMGSELQDILSEFITQDLADVGASVATPVDSTHSPQGCGADRMSSAMLLTSLVHVLRIPNFSVKDVHVCTPSELLEALGQSSFFVPNEMAAMQALLSKLTPVYLQQVPQVGAKKNDALVNAVLPKRRNSDPDRRSLLKLCMWTLVVSARYHSRDPTAMGLSGTGTTAEDCSDLEQCCLRQYREVVHVGLQVMPIHRNKTTLHYVAVLLERSGNKYCLGGGASVGIKTRVKIIEELALQPLA